MDIENVISLAISILTLMISWSAFRLSKRAFERHRSDLRLKVKYEHKTGLGHSFWVILVNHGRRLVTIEEVQLCLKSGKVRSYAELSGKNINLPVGLPVELQETARCHFQFPLYGENGLIHTPLDIKQAKYRYVALLSDKIRLVRINRHIVVPDIQKFYVGCFVS